MAQLDPHRSEEWSVSERKVFANQMRQELKSKSYNKLVECARKKRVPDKFFVTRFVF